MVEASGQKKCARQQQNCGVAIESLNNLLRVKKNGEVIATHFTAFTEAPDLSKPPKPENRNREVQGSRQVEERGPRPYEGWSR
jgi:hypothetical protein